MGMRIVAGSLGGRNFSAPRGHRTHPMSDKARGALFNVLGDLDGLTVLDAFAGSGALSLEAISRGAAGAMAIERDKAAQSAVKANIGELGLDDKVKLVSATTNAWLKTNPHAQFDIVFCDPPYDDLQLKLVEDLVAVVKPGGLMVLSWPGKQAVPELPGLSLERCKNYGDISLAFYRNRA